MSLAFLDRHIWIWLHSSSAPIKTSRSKGTKHILLEHRHRHQPTTTTTTTTTTTQQQHRWFLVFGLGVSSHQSPWEIYYCLVVDKGVREVLFDWGWLLYTRWETFLRTQVEESYYHRFFVISAPNEKKKKKKEKVTKIWGSSSCCLRKEPNVCVWLEQTDIFFWVFWVVASAAELET